MDDLVLIRHFNAPLERVFALVTRPENISKWWGPEGMTCPVFDIDLTKQGDWVTVMQNKDGERFKVSGKVTKTNPPNSVEFTWGWHDADTDKKSQESRIIFSLTASDTGGTTFTLTQNGFASSESRSGHKDGWSSSLRKLERLAG